MSSLDKFPDWSIFQKRTLPVEVEMLSPAAETVALLQSRLMDIRITQTSKDETRIAGLEALAQQAVFVVQLEASLNNYRIRLEEAMLNKVYRALRIVKDQMLTALQEAGLEVAVPLGKPFDTVAEHVDVLGWRHHENFTEEVVAEVLEPIIFSQGTLIRQGRVVVGAPLAQKPIEIAATTSTK